MQTSGSGQSSLITYAIILAIVAFAVYRRTRRQPVRPTRAIVIAAVIVLLSGVGLFGVARGQLLDFVLAPIALAVGFGLGWVLMGTINFWRDETTGQLWMQGGVLYVLIWLATYALRLGVEVVAGGGQLSFATPPHPEPGPLGLLSIDMLFVSMGLWIARAAALVQRSRKAGEPVPVQ